MATRKYTTADKAEVTTCARELSGKICMHKRHESRSDNICQASGATSLLEKSAVCFYK